MDNNEIYLKAFMDTFGVDEDTARGLKYQAIPAWDSVGHMSLVAALEDGFNIMMDTEDIIDMNSFEKGKEILSKKYEVTFN